MGQARLFGGLLLERAIITVDEADFAEHGG